MIEVREETSTSETISKYCTVPMAFRVESFYIPRLVPGTNNKWELEESRVSEPYIKDYDDHESPHEWTHRFNLSEWGVLSAFDAGNRIGGALIAFNTPGIDMLEGRSDLAVIWDIRIQPTFRNKGIGSRLFAEAMKWSTHRDCKEIKIETQNINVPACRFYTRMGCELRSVNYGTYPTLPEEIQFLWYREL